MVLDAESGSYYARCLGCMEAGPECPIATLKIIGPVEILKQNDSGLLLHGGYYTPVQQF
jgi:hypothetical protein